MLRLFLTIVLITSCSMAYGNSSVSTSKATDQTKMESCEECHTSLSTLDATKESPTLDATKLVVSERFIKSGHNANGCSSCHGGNPLNSTRNGAHKELIADPVAVDGGETACGQCHTDIVTRHKGSLHYTTQGLKNAYFGRLSKDDTTHKLAEESWRSKSCVDCHASCGTCHISRPRDPWVQTGPKGLLSNHEFQRFDKRADAENTCYVCHAGSITDPEAGYQKHDVHYKAGMTCMSCHNEKEVHGDGTTYQTMIHSGAVSTECTQCHEQISGTWHSETHQEKASCQACHSMPYRSCTECHGWQRIIDQKSPPFQVTYGIKLGISNHKLTTLVKGPVDPKMLADDGLPEVPIEKLNTQSSWYAGAPHNVILPEPEQKLCDRCHGPGTALLKDADLQFPDHERKHLQKPLKAVDAASY